MNFKLNSPYIEDLSIGDNEFLFDNGTVDIDINNLKPSIYLSECVETKNTRFKHCLAQTEERTKCLLEEPTEL